MSSPAAHSLLAPRSSKLSRFLVFSVGLHVAVVVAGVILAGLQAEPRIALDQKPIKATLIRRGKPRDEKLLPRKETPPPPPKEVKAPPQPTPPAPTATPTPPAAVVPVATAKPAPAPAPQAGEKAGVDRKKALFSAFDRTAKQAEEPEELEGAEDGDPDGNSATQEGERYYGMLSAQIKRNYSLPDTLSANRSASSLKALIRIRIGNAGQLLAASLVTGSENSQFDNAVLAAVKRTAPFSPPPSTCGRRTCSASGAFRWSSHRE